MPLVNDPKGGGTYSDGSTSGSYCSFCYEGGRFTRPDMTVNEMKDLSAERLHARGFPKFLARFMVRNLHKLERWNVGDRPLAQSRR